MKKQSQHTLSSWQVAVSLMTMHYGLGMLVGTGQDIAQYGAIGMAYAVSTSLGTLAILPFAKLYWQRFVPIWDLFQKRYGDRPAGLTAFLSSFWMVGVIGSYLLGGAAAAQLFGLPYWGAMLLLLAIIYILSLVRVNILSRIFLFMLVAGSCILFVALMKVGGIWFFRAMTSFFSVLPAPTSVNSYGIFVNTILLTAIGMDFHQFIVRGKSLKGSRLGIFIAAIGLFIISFMIGGTILGSLSSLPRNKENLQVLPLILAGIGKQSLGKYGVLFVLPILFVAVGSGSGVTKVLAQAVHNFLGEKKYIQNQRILHACILIAALLVALTSKSVIQLIVAFYATYLGAVLVPFLAFLFEKKLNLYFDEETVFAAMVAGFFTTLGVYVIHLMTSVFPDVSLAMILAGLLVSALTMGLYKTIEKRSEK